MKKLISILVAVSMLLITSFSAYADTAVQDLEQPTVQETAQDDEQVESEQPANEQISVTMSVNHNTVMSAGVAYQSTAPILVFGNVYADLYAMAEFMGYQLCWIDENGAVRVQLSANDKSVDYTVIATCDDLANQPYKFFIKDDKIFASIKELADFMGYSYEYKDGIICIGDENPAHNQAFTQLETSAFDAFVREKYPPAASYVVNPYQKYSYETMMSDAEKLRQMYPDLIKTSYIGASVEFRNLLLIELGKGDTRIFVCGTHHAREYISTTYLMYAIDRYAYAYRTNSMWDNYNIRDLLDKVTFCIVPMVNPDGVNLVQNGLESTPYMYDLAGMSINEGAQYGYAAWKANIRGVDVNWNYDKDWSPKKNKKPRGSMGFNGDYPNSEPETVAMCNYLDSNDFQAYLSFHTQGKIFYWADSKTKPIGIYATLKATTGFPGYVSGSDEYGGSFFDYVYRKFDKATVTVELCPYIGNFPYPDEKFDDAWEPAKNVLPAVANQLIYINSLK